MTAPRSGSDPPIRGRREARQARRGGRLLSAPEPDSEASTLPESLARLAAGAQVVEGRGDHPVPAAGDRGPAGCGADALRRRPRRARRAADRAGRHPALARRAAGLPRRCDRSRRTTARSGPRCARRTEEVGLDPASVEVVAELPELFIPVTGFVVTPVLAWWREPHAVRPVDARRSPRSSGYRSRNWPIPPPASGCVTPPAGSDPRSPCGACWCGASPQVCSTGC